MATAGPMMMRGLRSRHVDALGLSVAEILVATTVFVIAAAISLSVFGAMIRSYHAGENVTSLNQSVRVGLDRLAGDLRRAGLNLDPDGAGRPDEAFEGAWETAITLRGDMDADDPAARSVPEAALSGGAFAIVTTGNDEIVTYALAKPDGAGGASLAFEADVLGVPRDGVVESVQLSRISPVHDDPPYTLYRLRVNRNGTGVIRTPIADNIYSLGFRYYDGAGMAIGPATPGEISDDLGGMDGALVVAERSRIRRVLVTLIGLAPDPDPAYLDREDPFPSTAHHRKLTLSIEVVPRNAGTVSRPASDDRPPAAPGR